MKAKENVFYETKRVTLSVISILAIGFVVIFGSCVSLFIFGFQPQSIPVVNEYLEVKAMTFHVGCSGSTEDAVACLSKALAICGRQKNGAQTLYIRQITSHGDGQPADVFFQCGANSNPSASTSKQAS